MHTTPTRSRYAQQAPRPAKNPPHVSLTALRSAVGLSIEEVCGRIEEETGDRPSRGTVSAIENGRRGASATMLVSLARAYGLPDDAITTDYEPRSTTESVVA